MLADHDARSRISSQVSRFHVAAARDDAEATLSPLMPDGGKQDTSIAPVCGKYGKQREFEEVAQVVHREAFAHHARLPRTAVPPVLGQVFRPSRVGAVDLHAYPMVEAKRSRIRVG